MNLRLERITREIATRSFECQDEKEMAVYFRKHALRNDQSNLNIAYVALDENGEIAGFFTVSSSHVEYANWPAEVTKTFPRYPIPVVLIGKLAARESGRGIGFFLLSQALQKAIVAAESVGSFAVIVDALSQKAKSFYLHYGFHEFFDDPMRLYVTLAELHDSVANAK